MENNKTNNIKTPKQKQHTQEPRPSKQEPTPQKPHQAQPTQNHEHKASKPSTSSQYSLRDLIPLLAIFALVGGFTAAKQWYQGWDMHTVMYDFMGSFFLVFGAFKAMNLKGFAKAYAMYDIITKKYHWYGYVYPFLEIGLGACYLMHFAPTWVNASTLVLMLVSSIGVAKELMAKRAIMCACLGAVFKIPMTWVTLAEDLLMAAMAAWMLLW